MEKEIIKWINKNAVDIKSAGKTLLILNLILISFTGITGEFGWLFLHIPNIIFTNIFISVPMVYLVKIAKELK